MFPEIKACSFCGKRLPVVHWVDGYTPVHLDCTCTFENRMTAWKNSVARRAQLLEMPRPVVGSPERKEWIEVRRRRKPAKYRNRCKHSDGRRTWDKWTNTCAHHFLMHLKFVDTLPDSGPVTGTEADLWETLPRDDSRGPDAD